MAYPALHLEYTGAVVGEQQNPEGAMYECIVVGTDGSPTASAAVRRAAGLAQACSCPLHLVGAFRTTIIGADVVPEMSLALAEVGDWMLRLESDTQLMLETAAVVLQADGVKTETHAVPGHPATAILAVASAEGADLVVVGNEGMRGVRRLLGCVASRVSHQAPCDVLIVHTT